MPSTDAKSFASHNLGSPNLMPEENREPVKPLKQKKSRRRPILSCFFLVLLIILASCTALIARSNNDFFVGVKNGFLVRQLTHIFNGSKNELKGETEDRINFLLLGIGGPGHDGPYLTDTIILASFQPSTGRASILSIPRDLIVPDKNGGFIKVNHIYALNQKNGLAVAFDRTKELIGNAFDLPIHYMGVVDFQGFIEVIDTIGGVDVTVEKSFTDYQFPAGPNQYQVVSFEKGAQKMDGITALRYARSRHGNNGEGSDFARSKRQQIIILSTKEKLASFNTIFNPKKITTLFNLVNEYTKTNIEPWEMVKLVQMGKNVNASTIATTVLDDSPNGYLYSGISSIDGAYILQPRSGGFKELQRLAQNMLDNNQFASEAPLILIQNGTTIPNLAGSSAESMKQVGIQPVDTVNAERQNYVTSALYDYTDGAKPNTRDWLESKFNVKAITNIPINLLPYTVARNHEIVDDEGSYKKLDFLLILGEDVEETEQIELIRTLTPSELTSTSTATSTNEIEEMNDDEAPVDEKIVTDS